MKKLFSMKRDPKIQVNSQITSFLTPKQIYLPIHPEDKLQTKSPDIKKNQLLYRSGNTPFYSPISGKILDAVTLKDQTYLVLENNFKEECLKEKKHPFPESLKDTPLSKKEPSLYYNGITNDPYNVTTIFYHKQYKNELLEVLDMLRETSQSQEVRILLKETDTESIEAFSSILGIYPFISLQLVPDVYPIGHPQILKKVCHIQDEEHVFTPLEALELYETKINHCPLTEVLVTISGNRISPQVVKVKIGTSAQELMSSLYPNQPITSCYINTIMAQEETPLDQIIITKEVQALLFFEKTVSKVTSCLSCGKCLEICPMGCNPIQKKKMENCIQCGLCTYICPAHLSLGKGSE